MLRKFSFFISVSYRLNTCISDTASWQGKVGKKGPLHGTKKERGQKFGWEGKGKGSGGQKKKDDALRAQEIAFRRFRP
jgi:hypothetical protein